MFRSVMSACDFWGEDRTIPIGALGGKRGDTNFSTRDSDYYSHMQGIYLIILLLCFWTSLASWNFFSNLRDSSASSLGLKGTTTKSWIFLRIDYWVTISQCPRWYWYQWIWMHTTFFPQSIYSLALRIYFTIVYFSSFKEYKRPNFL